MLYNLEKGWSVLQDIHEFGELFKIYNDDFDPRRFGGTPDIQPMEPWTPIDRLEHLQLTLAANPYYGRALRQFNEAPWWYKNEFEVASGGHQHAVLRFNGVDYFADVWLNGHYLGAHEGYNTPFAFEVGHLLRWNAKNLLVVKVRAPWENEILPGFEYIRFCTVIRDQMKGTYEHSDTFMPRDVNPIGIWDRVTLEIYDGIRLVEKPFVDPHLNEDYSEAEIRLEYPIVNHLTEKKVRAVAQITAYGSTKVIVGKETQLTLPVGVSCVKDSLRLENPRLWTVWERGEAHRYTVSYQLYDGEVCLLSSTQHFGVRDITLVRDQNEMSFYLNGEKIYMRGTTYFPNVYISAVERAHYVRDIEKAKAAGMNTLRIHVHAEKDEFYELCDEHGILLMQDSDFNWVHPATEEWGRRATKMFEEMLIRLRNHPSIYCWVLLNEPRGDNFLHQCPGPQFKDAADRLDPKRPTILSSWERNDPESGDSHNYMGSLDGAHTHYADIYGTSEKFNTEFGMDALPCFATLRGEPELVKILGRVVDGTDLIQYYQYRYIKYFIEHYRTQKWEPCSGHYQFLFTDCAPTSHFGVYDWKGLPKYAVRAFEESNQPIGILMETKKHEPVTIWVVNDLLKTYLGAVAVWEFTDETGSCVWNGETVLDVTANGRVKVTDVYWHPEGGREYTVRLELRDSEGRLLAKNLYEKAFNPPEHVKGHPTYVHHGIGLRTYWAWMPDEDQDGDSGQMGAYCIVQS